MQSADAKLAWRDGTVIHMAEAPLPAAWTIDPAPARDGHTVGGALRFAIAVPSNSTDRQTIVETLLGSNAVVTAADATVRLSSALAQAARTVFAGTDAGLLLSDVGRADLLAALKRAGERAAFAFGIEFVGPFDLHLDSPSLAAAELKRAERARAEADARARAEHLRRAADLASAVATTPPTVLLRDAAASDREPALAALLASGAKRGADRALYVVAGMVVLRLRPADDFRAERPSGDLPDVGALRSVSAVHVRGTAVRLVGGQRGIATLDARDDEPYLDPDAVSRMGFNAIAFLESADEYWATHSERGLVRWRRIEPARPTAVHAMTDHGAATAGAQDLVAIDRSTAACSSGATVFVATADEIKLVHTGDTDVVGLVTHDGALHVVHADGTWVRLETGTWRQVSQQATGGPVLAAAALPWVGGVRLLLARRDGGVDCLGVDDTLVTRYASRHVGLRALAASEAYVAAMTADRQRILLWHAADGREPIREIHVASLAGARVAGMCFG